jgi:hypothetical protein
LAASVDDPARRRRRPLKREVAERSNALTHLYALIGSITSSWSHVENSVDVTIWSLMHVDAHAGASVTAQIQSLEYRLYALIALVNLLGGSPQLIKSLNQFKELVGNLGRGRNRAVHDAISAPDDDEPAAITITARRKLVYGFFKGKTAEYTKLDAEIAMLLAEYLKLDEKIHSELGGRSQSSAE